ncbi:MAG: type I-U CRISPR-associated helicase/endonuclease Cas3 [Boseongicola sp.]|nr:type I-U CRISPR-associated helicase/endonuclease Cas3 [Boseongicola sp.]
MTGRSPSQLEPGLPPMPAFPDFYLAINGRMPFPWQARLASIVATDGRWPAEVGVPTGLGKTACLEVALWWLASEAHLDSSVRRAPTRIWWVVNRRLLVDTTAEHAESLARALRQPDTLEGEGATGIVADVAHRLRSLSAEHAAAPLDVIRMQGGVSPELPTDPSCPTVLLCTLPMYGSRLLFRGYGSRSRSVDAAMAGSDSLVLLDESHLATHLARLIPALAECAPAACDVLPAKRSRPVQVSLTATGYQDPRSRLDLDEEDLRHPVVNQRLGAAKSLELRDLAAGSQRLKANQGSRLLADTVHELVREAAGPASFLVFANTPDTARKAFDRLCRTTADSRAEVLLLTARMREREAQEMRERLLDPVHGMAATREACIGRQRHLIVVATQTLETGADLDAENLVTEQCGVRALTQRLGRLNRFGRHPCARAIYLHLPPPGEGENVAGKADWPVYGAEPQMVLKRLEMARGADGRVFLPPGRIAEVLGAPSDGPGQVPEVMPEILREWTKTTVPPKGEAPVEPYFDGLAAPRYSVSLIWRVHVPGDGGRLWPRATDSESISVPISEVREALRDDKDVCRLACDGVTVERVDGVGALIPNDCIVLSSDRGLLDEFGWNPQAREPVVDASLAGKGVPLDPVAIERLCGVTNLDSEIERATSHTHDEDGPDHADRDEAAAEILEAVRAAPEPPGWHAEGWKEFVGSLTSQVVNSRHEVARLQVARPIAETRVDEFDEHSIAIETQDLDSHGQAVAERARSIATCIGIPDELRDTVALAGRFHDIGKSDLRFQRWLDPDGIADSPVAKSNLPRHLWESRRRDSGWPRGGRHEALSARLARARIDAQRDLLDSDELSDLLIHLVISHHGKGRPLVTPVGDETAQTLSSELKGVNVDVPASLEQVDWDQPGRFWRLNRCFGPWGLALLESIVIRANHANSGGDPTETEANSCRK